MPPSTSSLRPPPRVGSARWPTALLLALLISACGDDPFQIRWSSAPDTVLLYSLARPELNLHSAFNFTQRSTVRIEAPDKTGEWDVALDTQGGQLALLPPGALGIDSRAQVAELSGRTLDEVEEAPSDTLLYAAVQPVPVQLGSVYVIRTRSVAGAFGAKCVYFAKLAPLEIDVTEGRLRFVFEMNPVCNDHQLVPPEYSPE